MYSESWLLHLAHPRGAVGSQSAAPGSSFGFNTLLKDTQHVGRRAWESNHQRSDHRRDCSTIYATATQLKFPDWKFLIEPKSDSSHCRFVNYGILFGKMAVQAAMR